MASQIGPGLRSATRRMIQACWFAVAILLADSWVLA
jgi:hypothetical protein